MWTNLSRVFSLWISWHDVLVLVDLYSLANRARCDELFYLSPHAWPKIPNSGHIDGLLLASMGVFMQYLDCCLSKSWRQKEDGAGAYFWRFSSTQKSHSPPFFFCQEKSGVDANLSAAASV